jgi:xanthine/uracil/vitamin C permease (AzgA family)
MDHGAVFVATCLAAAAGSIIMGLYANYPIALAPGMGLNAYFAFTVVPELGGNWQLALALVFLSGVLFFALSLSPLRAWLIDAIPMDLKLGIAAGIGFFLALIGLQNAGIVADEPTTLVTLGRHYHRRTRRDADRSRRRPGALARTSRCSTFTGAHLPCDGPCRRFQARARHHRARPSFGHHSRHGGNSDWCGAPGRVP